MSNDTDIVRREATRVVRQGQRPSLTIDRADPALVPEGTMARLESKTYMSWVASNCEWLEWRARSGAGDRVLFAARSAPESGGVGFGVSGWPSVQEAYGKSGDHFALRNQSPALMGRPT